MYPVQCGPCPNDTKINTALCVRFRSDMGVLSSFLTLSLVDLSDRKWHGQSDNLQLEVSNQQKFCFCFFNNIEDYFQSYLIRFGDLSEWMRSVWVSSGDRLIDRRQEKMKEVCVFFLTPVWSVSEGAVQGLEIH